MFSLEFYSCLALTFVETLDMSLVKDVLSYHSDIIHITQSYIITDSFTFAIFVVASTFLEKINATSYWSTLSNTYLLEYFD